MGTAAAGKLVKLGRKRLQVQTSGTLWLSPPQVRLEAFWRRLSLDTPLTLPTDAPQDFGTILDKLEIGKVPPALPKIAPRQTRWI